MRMLHSLRSLAAPLLLTAAAAFSQNVPNVTVVNTSAFDTTFGNPGKGIFDPQVLGLWGVAYGAGLFVTVGGSANDTSIRWLTSPDGTTWTPRSQTIPAGLTTSQTSRVHFLNGKFLFFIGTGGTSTTQACTSSDGLTWTYAKVADNRINAQEFDASPTLTVVAANNGNQWASADLTTWTARPVVANGSGYDHLDLAYGNGRFYSSVNGFGGTTFSSADAVTWANLTSAQIVGGSRVETGNGLVLIIAGSDRYRSADGAAFTKVTPVVPTGWLTPGGEHRFAGGRFVASAINLSNFRTGFLASPDGVNWTPLAYYDTPALSTGRLQGQRDLAYGNGKYVVVGADVQSGSTYIPFIWTLDAAVGEPPTIPVAPAITAQPIATAAVVGRSATLSVATTGTGNSYQWRFNNNAINGATAATYTIASVTAASAGNYAVVVTNSVGTVTSATVALTIVNAAQAGRLINLSVLTDIATATDEFTLGYVVGGAATTGSKPLVIRAAGPSLGALGVPGTLADPKLETFAGSTSTGVNDNWGGGTQLTADLAAVGAFAYSGPTSRDSAVSASITTRDNSVKVTGVGGATGTVIAEIYDATPSTSFAATTPRLLNVSVRKHLGSGLTAGFVLGGTTPTRVLIRVVGPGLAAFGVGGTVTDPQLTLFNDKSAKIAENNDWAGTPELIAAFNSVGAFALPAASSKDAALLISLPPGLYSVQATGVANTTGTALVEVYEVP